jgi:lauroyl/myristoyl acyltransferase
MLMDATDDSLREVRAVVAGVVAAGHPCGLTPVPSDRGVRVLVRDLQHGKTVYLLIDPTPSAGRDHIDVPFLGQHLRLARGVAWLALRTGAAVIPVSVHAGRAGKCHIELHTPLTGAERESEQSLLSSLAQTLERDVRVRPAAWLKWKDFHLMTEL